MTRNKNKPRIRKRRQGGGEKNFDEREVEKAFMNLKKNLPQSPQDWYEAYNRAKAGATNPAQIKEEKSPEDVKSPKDAKVPQDVKCPQDIKSTLKRGRVGNNDEDCISQKKPSLSINKNQEFAKRNDSKPNQSAVSVKESLIDSKKNLTMYEKLKMMAEMLDGAFSTESEVSIATSIMNTLKNMLDQFKRKSLTSPMKDVINKTGVDGDLQKMEVTSEANSTKFGNKSSSSGLQSPKKNADNSPDIGGGRTSSGSNPSSTSSTNQLYSRKNVQACGKMEDSKETKGISDKTNDMYHRRDTYLQSKSLLGNPFEERKTNIGQNLPSNSNKNSQQNMQAPMINNRGSSSRNWGEKNMSSMYNCSSGSNISPFSSGNRERNQFGSKAMGNYKGNIPDEGSNELYERRERNPQSTQFANQNVQEQNETMGSYANRFGSGMNWERRGEETQSSNKMPTNSDQAYFRRNMPTNYSEQMRNIPNSGSNELYERRENINQSANPTYNDFKNPNSTKDYAYESCGANWERRSKESVGQSSNSNNSRENMQVYQSGSRRNEAHIQEATTKHNTNTRNIFGGFASSNGPSNMNWRAEREGAPNSRQEYNNSNPNLSSYDRGDRYGNWMKNGQERNFSGNRNSRSEMNRFRGKTY